MSDRVAVLSAGRIEQIGTVNEIYYQPATRFVATFIGETNIVEATLLGREAGLIHCQLEGGLRLSVKDSPRAQVDKNLLSLRPEKIRLFRQRPEGINVFPGRVCSEVFKGAVDEMTIRVEGGLELGALLTNDGQQEFDFHEGEDVFCRIQPEDINIVTS